MDILDRLEQAERGSGALSAAFHKELGGDLHTPLRCFTTNLQAVYEAIPKGWYLDDLHDGKNKQAQLWREEPSEKAVFVGFRGDSFRPKDLICALCMVVIMAHRIEAKEAAVDMGVEAHHS